LIFYLINGGLVKVQNHLLATIRENSLENNPKFNKIIKLQAFSANGIVPCSVTSVEQKQRFSRIKRLPDFGLINRTGSLVLICLSTAYFCFIWYMLSPIGSNCGRTGSLFSVGGAMRTSSMKKLLLRDPSVVTSNSSVMDWLA